MTATIGISLILFILLEFTIRSNGEEDFDITLLAMSNDVLNVVFPSTCPSGEFWKSETIEKIATKCQYQKGNMGEMLSLYADDVERLGCKADKRIAKLMGEMFGSSDYVNNPLYKRIGDDCGFCGIKPACCGPKNAQIVLNKLLRTHSELKGVSPFYFEAVKGTRCSADSDKACSYKPLTPEEFSILRKMQPFTKNVDTSDGCNFAQFGYTEWESARESPSFPVGEPIYNKFLCRAFNTNRPRLNCIKDHSTQQCICCCHNNFPKRQGSSYKCVPNNNGVHEKICLSI